MSHANMPGHVQKMNFFIDNIDFADILLYVKLSIKGSHSDRIITAILQLLDTSKQVRRSILFSDISNDSTHDSDVKPFIYKHSCKHRDEISLGQAVFEAEL